MVSSTTGLITPGFLSESTNGRQIAVDSTTVSGATLLHTAVTGEGDIDMITLEAVNTSTAIVELTLLWGGTADADKVVIEVGPKRGRQVVVDRCYLNNGLQVSAYAGTASVINVYGEVRTVKL